MNYEAKRAAMLERHAKELKELDSKQLFCAALLGSGFPEPDLVCVHDNHMSAKFKAFPDKYGEESNFRVADVIDLIDRFRPFLIPMEPARAGSMLSIYPERVRSKPVQWDSLGVEYVVDLHQSAYGEVAGEPYPRHYCRELRWWVQIGGFVVHCSAEVSGLPHKCHSLVRWNGRSNSREYPNIPGARAFSFAPGSAIGLESNHLFASVEDARSALCGNPEGRAS